MLSCCFTSCMPMHTAMLLLLFHQTMWPLSVCFIVHNSSSPCPCLSPTQVVLGGLHHYIAMQLPTGTPLLMCGTPADVWGTFQSLQRFLDPTPLQHYAINLYKPEEHVHPYLRVLHSMMICSTSAILYKVCINMTCSNNTCSTQ